MPLDQWSDRLLSPERALHLAGDWPVCATMELAELSQFEPEAGQARQADQVQINLRCLACGQSCGQLGIGDLAGADMAAFHTSIAELLSGVLRHKVMAHDQALNTEVPTDA